MIVDNFTDLSTPYKTVRSLTAKRRGFQAGRLATGIGDRLVELAFERGLLTLGCGQSAIRICPALSIKTSEIDEGLQILEHAITLAEREVVT